MRQIVVGGRECRNSLGDIEIHWGQPVEEDINKGRPEWEHAMPCMSFYKYLFKILRSNLANAERE
jgi:hypothetical protein